MYIKSFGTAIVPTREYLFKTVEAFGNEEVGQLQVRLGGRWLAVSAIGDASVLARIMMFRSFLREFRDVDQRIVLTVPKAIIAMNASYELKASGVWSNDNPLVRRMTEHSQTCFLGTGKQQRFRAQIYYRTFKGLVVDAVGHLFAEDRKSMSISEERNVASFGFSLLSLSSTSVCVSDAAVDASLTGFRYALAGIQKHHSISLSKFKNFERLNFELEEIRKSSIAIEACGLTFDAR